MACLVVATEHVTQLYAWFGHKVDTRLVTGPFDAVMGAIGKICSDDIRFIFIFRYVYFAERQHIKEVFSGVIFIISFVVSLLVRMLEFCSWLRGV